MSPDSVDSPDSPGPLTPELRKFFSDHGRRGGKLSSAARMKKISPERRSEIAKIAVAAREAKRLKKKKRIDFPD